MDFQAALLALLKQVPLNTDIPELMQRWLYFYEHSIGCVGVLKDWLIRTVAAALHENSCINFLCYDYGLFVLWLYGAKIG